MASYLSNILLRANSGMAFYKDETTQSFRKMIEARRIEASYQIEINSYSELGKQIIQHYPGTVEIRGTMELYICSTYFINRVYDYYTHGKPFSFSLQVKNGILYDESEENISNRNIGYQSITLENVLISQVPITSLGLDSSASSGSFDFVADGISVDKSFNQNYLNQLSGQ